MERFWLWVVYLVPRGGLELFLSPRAGLDSPFGQLGAGIGSLQNSLSFAAIAFWGLTLF